MDYFTKWPEAIPIPDQEASTVAEELVRTWISRYGVPTILYSDQGTHFNSALFTELWKLLGILKTRATALHPESYGMVERERIKLASEQMQTQRSGATGYHFRKESKSGCVTEEEGGVGIEITAELGRTVYCPETERCYLRVQRSPTPSQKLSTLIR
ncbi:hypothetical protein AVEN_151027-1 [Araneus ventricosus]|uniref:Integrase catalytic domain-containing protein n=1 Tax=Araneus ventricosus TaxID=182803 RepID=A0A4Y2IAD2_ARAVE|nr:hypothetical protein AVEN_151027-1 [Araneus ventricosus]